MRDILGTLTDAERTHLSQELAINADAREMSDDMHKTLATDYVLDYVKKKPSIDPADLIIERIHRQKRRRTVTIGAVASAAAAVTAFFVISALYKPSFKVNTDVAASTSQHIQLQLANGQLIDLNTDTSKIIAGNVVMKNANKTLTYTAQSAAAEYATLRVPAGKDYTIHLSDGTAIQLNAATSIRFPLSFTGNTREVYINGEAYLKVSKNSKPFVVHLPNSIVRVLGTEFNVNTYDSGVTKVALVKGAVKLCSKVDSFQLKPGQEAVSSMTKISTHNFDEVDVLSWREGKFLFSNTKLEEVCRVIPRWFGITLQLDNKEVANKHFSGTIDRNQPVEDVLKALKATNGIDYYTDDKGIIHIK